MRRKIAVGVAVVSSFILFLFFQNFSSTTLSALNSTVAELNIRFGDIRSLWPYQSCESAGGSADSRPYDKMYFCNEIPVGAVNALGSVRRIEALRAELQRCKTENRDWRAYEDIVRRHNEPRPKTCEQIYGPEIARNEAARSEWSLNKEIFSSSFSFQDREGNSRSLPVVIKMDRQIISSSQSVLGVDGTNSSVFIDRVYGRHILRPVQNQGSQFIEMCSFFPGLRLTGMPASTKYTIEKNWAFSYSVDIHINPGSFKFDNAGMCLLGRVNPQANVNESLFQVAGLKPIQLAGAEFDGLKVRVDAGWLGNFILDVASRVITGMNFNSLVTSKIRAQLNTYAQGASQGMGNGFLSQAEYERILSSVDSSNPITVFSGQYLQELYKINVMADHNFVGVRDAVQRVRLAVRDGSIKNYLDQSQLEVLKAQYRQQVEDEVVAPARTRLSSEVARVQAVADAERSRFESDFGIKLDARFSELKQMLDREVAADPSSYRQQLQIRYNQLVSEAVVTINQRSMQLNHEAQQNLESQIRPLVVRLNARIAATGLSQSVKDILAQAINHSAESVKAQLKNQIDAVAGRARGRLEAVLATRLQQLQTQLVKTTAISSDSPTSGSLGTRRVRGSYEL